MAKLGQTFGHVKATALLNRPYPKPSLGGRVIYRHPGVDRRSVTVVTINEGLEKVRLPKKPWEFPSIDAALAAAKHPSTICKLTYMKDKNIPLPKTKKEYIKINMPAKQFWDCVRPKLKEIVEAQLKEFEQTQLKAPVA
jgi:hypothetical protein